jgi:DNA-binding MarR family transcriptional regulator
MERIEDCLTFKLGKAYQQINRLARLRLAPYEVTPSQFAVLKALWECDAQSGSELGERLRLDSATITGVVDRMERTQMVFRHPHPDDRRINRVTLTTRGREAEAELTRIMDELNTDILASLASAEASAFLATLSRLADLDE